MPVTGKQGHRFMKPEAKKMNETFNERYTPPIKFGCHISQKMTAKNAYKGQK